MADEHKVGDEIPANCELIEVLVTELRLLFNPIDPSPPASGIWMRKPKNS